MAHYVDSFVVPVPKKTATYQAMARKFGKICIEHGALGYTEAITGVENMAMPFDGKRMFWGGFRTIVTLAPSRGARQY